MKRYLLAALVGLMVTPGLAAAQMMGGDRSVNDPSQPRARHEMQPQTRGSGMMAQDTETSGDCMMQGGMMGHDMPGGMTGSMMSPMMDGMMSGQNRGSMMMAGGMMNGQIDFAKMHQTLGLSDEQAERLRAGLRPFQKEAILALASLKVAELELADLLAVEKVDFGKVEAKLKEIEGLRTKARLSQLKATVAVKGVLSKEQLEKLQGPVGCTPPPVPAATQKDAAAPGESEHHMHQ